MNRKDEHLSLAKAFHKKKSNDLDRVRFAHQSFAKSAANGVDISTSFLSFQLPQPFYINAMTGGSQRAKKINQQLDIIGRKTGLLVATRSISAALKDTSLANTYQIIRKENPDGLVFTNTGAGLGVEGAGQALDLFQANALQIHVNMPRELVMPEGDRDFTNRLTRIEAIVQTVEVPVIVKEVGFGMSQETLEKLTSIGAQAADVSGQGETSFTQTESARWKKHELLFLDDWGQSTATSLLESQNWQKKLTTLDSGGMHDSLDIVKELALGAKSMGIVGTILASLISRSGLEDTLALVQQWQEEVRILYTLLEKKTIEELTSIALILNPVLVNWCHNRDIDSTVFARR